jgi:hypothetical protein
MGVLHLMLGSTILLGRGFMIQRQAGSGLLNGVMIGLGMALMGAAVAFFLRGSAPGPATGIDGSRMKTIPIPPGTQ